MGSQPIGHQFLRRNLLLLQEFAHQPQRRVVPNGHWRLFEGLRTGTRIYDPPVGASICMIQLGNPLPKGVTIGVQP